MFSGKARKFRSQLKRYAVLPVRLIVGYGFFAHGLAKVERGPEHFADVLHKLGVPLPHLASWATIVVELLGGLTVLTGAFVSIASVPMIVVLLVAIVTVHLPYGFSSVKLKDVTPAGPVFGMPGYEIDLLYIAGLLTLVMGGPGPFAIQSALPAWQRRKPGKQEHAPVHLDGPATGFDSEAGRIRRAVPGDAEDIARRFVESAVFHAGFDDRYTAPDFAAVAARYKEGKQHLSAKPGQAITLVAEIDGEIAGFVDARLERSCDPMHRDLGYCYLADIAVSPQHQKKGIGTQLIRAAEGWGREQGAEFASLEYHAANTAAGSFYQRQLSYQVVSMFAIKPL